jgi:hypothetical protein
MARLQLTQETFKRERTRLERALRGRMERIPLPSDIRMGLAWGDYLRQFVVLCVSTLDAFFAFILALWSPRKTTVPFRRDRPHLWNELVRKEMDLLHKFVHDEIVTACDAIRGNNKKVVGAAIDLLEKECEPLKAVIDKHLISHPLSRNTHSFSRWMMALHGLSQNRK